MTPIRTTELFIKCTAPVFRPDGMPGLFWSGRPVLGALPLLFGARQGIMDCVYLSAPFLCAEEVQNLRPTGQLCPPTPFWEGNPMSEFIPLSVPNFGEREADAARAAVLSGWVSTSGARVSEFEQAIADYLGMPRAVATNAGSSALHIAAMAAGIQAGDEVIVPTLTFIAAVNPLTRYIGAEPVFIGCDDSLCIDPDGVEDFCANHCDHARRQASTTTRPAPMWRPWAWCTSSATWPTCPA